MSTSVPVTSTETVRFAPPSEPHATLEGAERIMVATSALLQDLWRDPDFSPKTRVRWESLMRQYHDELQCAALRLARISGEGCQ